jgi:erythronate-4-phosphate dehydrogenase
VRLSHLVQISLTLLFEHKSPKAMHKPLIIAADRNIPFVAEACRELGEIRLFDVRDMQKLHIAVSEADVLLCRSTILVNEQLLGGTRVRFVATATSGTDHFDIPWLDERGIVWRSAAGSNARSVAEWFVAVLLELRKRGRLQLGGARIGVIGVGHVGRQVAAVAYALGMQLVLNDPPRMSRNEQPLSWSPEQFSTLDQSLRCDIVTLHTPLSDSGPHPTRHLIDASRFAWLSDHAAFINAARGDVVDSTALLEYLENSSATAALDVFPGEPCIESDLVDSVEIATPHIAGHSLDGKLLGTQMLHHALCEFLDQEPHWRFEQYLPEAPMLQCTVSEESVLGQVHSIVQQVYDPMMDDTALRATMSQSLQERAASFKSLRADYPIRREFGAFRVRRVGLSHEAAAMLDALGFNLEA